MSELICCTPKRLPDHKLEVAAQTARLVNPLNAPPPVARLASTSAVSSLSIPSRDILTTKWWGSKGVALTVGFMDAASPSLKAKILSHANAWGKTANVKFVESDVKPQVRISFGPGGYWSYIGTDIIHVPDDEQTMNLEGFTDETEDSEFFRVVRHEFGHTLGMWHEHMRAEIVALIDQQKAIAYFHRTQGWSKQEVIQQVLSPLDDADILIETAPDQTSIMCYQIPGQITKSGKPIVGGLDINANDYALCGLVYPRPESLNQLTNVA